MTRADLAAMDDKVVEEAAQTVVRRMAQAETGPDGLPTGHAVTRAEVDANVRYRAQRASGVIGRRYVRQDLWPRVAERAWAIWQARTRN